MPPSIKKSLIETACARATAGSAATVASESVYRVIEHQREKAVREHSYAEAVRPPG